MRDIHEQLEQRSSRARLKQRIAGAAVLLIVLAIFLPFIFNHSHLGATSPAVETDTNAAAVSAPEDAANPSQSPQPQLNSAEQPVDPAAAQNEMAAADQAIESGNSDAAQSMEVAAAESAPAQAQAQAVQTQTQMQQQQQQQQIQQQQQMQQQQQNQIQNQNQPQSNSLTPSQNEQAQPQSQSQPRSELQKTPQHSAPAVAAHSAAAAHGHWVVQVGSFTDPDRARQLVTKLRHRGLNAYIEPVSSHHLTRVYVGPLATQKEARALQAQVKNEYRLSGLVMEKRA